MTAPELSTGPKGFKINWPKCPLCDSEMRIIAEEKSEYRGWRYCTNEKCFWAEHNPLEMNAARQVCATIASLKLEIRNTKEETRNYDSERESSLANLNEAQDEAEKCRKQTDAMRHERDKANYISALHSTKESTELVAMITDLKAKADYARGFGLIIALGKSSDCREGHLAHDTVKGSTLHRLEEGIIELIDARIEAEKATKDADNLRAGERAADAHIGELRETIEDLKTVIEEGGKGIASAVQDIEEAEAFSAAALRDAFEEGLRTNDDPGATPPSAKHIERLWKESQVFMGWNEAAAKKGRSLLIPVMSDEGISEATKDDMKSLGTASEEATTEETGPPKENGGNENPTIAFT